MEKPTFPQFYSFPSNDKLEKLLSCTGKAESDVKVRNHDKHKYFFSLCRYSCTIPQWDRHGKQFAEQYEQSLLEMSLMESHEFLKWSQLASPMQHVFPIAVPDEGHSLFHAVSMAMWGLHDKYNTLEHLMKEILPRMVDRLYIRWQIQASGVKAEEKQTKWSNMITRLTKTSSVETSFTKDEGVDSLIIFILANLLHRPIIVIDVSSTACPQGVEGIYLPLENPAADCSKSPIILCHRGHMFRPLMFRSCLKALIPLHKEDLSILKVQYVLNEANAVISQYLDIQEKGIISEATGSTIALLCSSFTVMPLPNHFNSFDIHLEECLKIFQDLIASRAKNDVEKQSPFEHINKSNQTYVVEVTGSRLKDGSSSSAALPSFSSPPAISLFNPSMACMPKTGSASQLTNTQLSVLQNNYSSATNIAEDERERKGIGRKNKCLTPGCDKERDPGIGELCSSCFTHSTIDESGLELVSLNRDGQKKYILRHAYLPHIDQQQCSVLNTGNEFPWLENSDKGHSELPSISYLSAVNESCKGCSTYICSQKTYPYCHECSKSPSEKASLKGFDASAATSIYRRSHNDNGMAALKPALKPPFPNVVSPPPMNFSHPGRSLDTNSKREESENVQIAELFCQSESCRNLRQENSTLCLQCSCQREGFEKPSFSQAIIPPPLREIQSLKITQPQNFGHAEYLSHRSDEDVIEVSEAPSLTNEIHKCASPVCESIISSSQVLCEKCQDILIFHAQQHQQNLKGAKNDWENEQTLSTYRGGTFSSVIAHSPSSKIIPPPKTHSGKIQSPSDLIRKPNKTPQQQKLRHEREEASKSKIDRGKRTSDHSSHLCTATSVNLGVNLAPAVCTQEATQTSSLSTVVDNNFQKLYRQFTNEQLEGIPKCQSQFCQNYGNKVKSGFCNSCFSSLSEDERHAAVFGMTQCD